MLSFFHYSIGLFLLLWLNCCTLLRAQNPVSTEIDAAERTLQQILIRYSNQHKAYAYARLDLSKLYYQDINSYESADSLAYPALRFLALKYGRKSLEYEQGFRSIPFKIASLIDANLDLEPYRKQPLKGSPSHAQKLLKLSKAYQENIDNKAYFNCFKAFKLLEKSPYDSVASIYNYAYQSINPVVLNLVEQQIRLDAAQTNRWNALELANQFLIVARLQLAYQNNPLVFSDVKISYRNFKKALVLYDSTVGKESLQYQAAFYLMREEMQSFYPAETAFWQQLTPHQKPSNAFVEHLSEFLKKLDRVYFVDYDNEYVFEQVFRYLETYHGGAKNRLYQRLQKMHLSWNFDHQETQIALLQQKIDLAFLKHGTASRYYWLAKIELLNYQMESTDPVVMMHQFRQAFKQISQLYEEKKLKKPIASWLKLVAAPWNKILVNERKLQAVNEQGFPESFTEQLFRSGWFYLAQNLLESRGIELYKKALARLTPNDSNKAMFWLQQYLNKQPYDAIKALGTTLIGPFSALQIDQMLANPMSQIDSLYGQQSVPYAIAQELLADAHYKHARGNSQKALLLYQSALSSYLAKTGFLGHYRRLLNKICLNITKQQRWSNTDSRYFFEAHLNTLIRQKKSKALMAPYLKKYADWLYQSKQLIDAERRYRAYLEIETKQQEENSQIKIDFRVADILLKTNRLEASKKRLENCLFLAQQQGEAQLQYLCMNGLGQYYWKTEQVVQALEWYHKALEKLEKIKISLGPGSDSLQQKIAIWQLQSLQLMGQLFLENPASFQCEKHYQSIRSFLEENPHLAQKDFPLLNLDFAFLAYQQLQFEKSFRYSRLAIKNLKNKPLELAKAYQSLAKRYLEIGNDSMAGIEYRKMIQTDMKELENNYKNLSEQERFLYFEPIAKRINQYYNFVVNHPDPEQLIEVFNLHLKTKGLALETTTNVQELCKSTFNERLKKDCDAWSSMRKKWSKSIDLDLSSQALLRLNLRQLERRIVQYSTDIQNTFDSPSELVDFKRLKKQITQKYSRTRTALVDFILVEPQAPNLLEKTAFYYALMLHPDSIHPILIPLTSEEALLEVLNTDIRQNNLNYITDNLESNYLHDLVWAPLRPYLDSIEQLFICPSGQLNKIAFKTLKLDTWSTSRVMDFWTIRYVSSLQDLVVEHSPQQNTDPELIALVGGVQFDAIDSPGTKTSRYFRGNNVFKPLPGSFKEVKEIGKLFVKYKGIPLLLSGQNATEERFYDLIDQGPSILHLASHGFFYENESKQTISLSADDVSFRSKYELKLAQVKDPLLRSGIALAGINRIWQGASEIEGLENGILTALEVANLDLFYTKLVVLSACETGKGDIDNNEGILGLKRAFKSAGAQQLLLSLWKVPDEQTQLLMLYFYEAYLNKKSAYQALEIAQTRLRKIYSNPYYWAAFQLNESVFYTH